ncbi:piggyBac transposable element-derived protein 4-like [Spodoptera litura]|uniref:PiggyBac transposable element-derived protein 4-like n=1 Tax=Spodoptera litura TaxID=69820 RepID=A0A9J7EEN5_SPOLT|nr:piggyBac transposable element-derived protein 4-like [Spodoptera litura]
MSRRTNGQKQRVQLQQQREKKEVSHFLMPDAPPVKKSRKGSPVRMPCPLLPGTPEVPPPRVLQPWELNIRASLMNKSGPIRVLEEDFDEVVSNDSATTETSQLVITPSTPVVIDTAECCAFQNVSPTPSSSTGAEPSDILVWEQSAGLNPDSDVEEETLIDSEPTRVRDANDAGEVLCSELSEALENLDRQDDNALREIANEDMLDFDWSHDHTIFTGQREIFTGIAGPTFTVDGMSPFQIFSKIWDDDIINLIVRETNRYGAMLCSAKDLQTFSRLRRWTPITSQELWTYFGILMLQSITQLPVESEYWRPCLPYLKLGNFANIMSFHRFMEIKRCLHFTDNTVARDNPNKLTKIKPIIDHLNKKFSYLYLPEQQIAIDESLLLWKGRLSFAQLIANKAAQVGIKSYELCESRTGYLWQMMVYTGKENHNVGHDSQEEPQATATSKIVYHLVRPLLNKGHTLIMDNFYNSPLLARTLKAKKTDVMGTLRLNRQFVPESLRQKNKSNMRTGEVAFSQTKDITIVVWNDSNVVSMISTYHKAEVGGKEKYGYYKYKPQVVLDYNLSMGGIDKKDQMIQAFPIERIRNHVWYKKLFRRLVNVSIHNSFVMFSSVVPGIRQRAFRVRLADEILQKFSTPKIQAPPATGHFPARNASKRSRCKWCALNKKDTCTVWKCDTCNVNLCVQGCFRDYHIAM